jgi:hypothetical protein
MLKDIKDNDFSYPDLESVEVQGYKFEDVALNFHFTN